ncbi:MAG: type II secretion system F family protein [Elusimicrobiaceae bacterium]|nr:type II secretion system F family protein [Elusimicrobiaceae bacterium]
MINMGMIHLMLLLLAIGGTICIFLSIIMFLTPAPVTQDISDLEAKQVKSASSFAKLKPEENLLDRVAFYVLNFFHLQEPLENICVLLGSPERPQPVDILYYKIYAAIATPFIAYFLFGTWLVILFIPLGFYLPDLYYKSEIAKRQQDMIKNFATTVDLMALVIESGLDYMTAFERIVKIAKEKTLLEVEIEKTLNETKLGYSRRESLEHLAARTGVQDIRSFVGLIIQSDELGTSLVQLLRNFSTDLRFRRLNQAEKLAAQASTKMLIPLFIFIFPVVFIMMLSPMIADFINGGMPF